MSDTKTIHILIADDHLMVRKGLSALVQGIADFTLIGEAENGKQAIVMYSTLHPDVVLMDIVMPDVGGIEAIRTIRAEDPAANIIALTSFSDEQLISQALTAGARGFLYKDVSVDELINAIRQSHLGQVTLDPEAMRVLMDRLERSQKQEVHARHGEVKLSPREKDVLQLLVQGKTTKQMALILSVQPST